MFIGYFFFILIAKIVFNGLVVSTAHNQSQWGIIVKDMLNVYKKCCELL